MNAPGLMVCHKKIFKDFFPFSAILLPWQPVFVVNYILLTIFVELHPRNIPAKFYQDWPSGFGGEDF